MNNLLQRLKDWYHVNVKDNAISFMNESINLFEIPRSLEEVKSAIKRMDERRYSLMREKFDNISKRYSIKEV